MANPFEQGARPLQATPTSILFACNLNTIRSPMAEALAKHLCGRSFYVESVGVRRGDEPDAFAVAVMDEIGLDISRHRPKSFDELEDVSFDLIISLTPEAHHRALEWARTMACDVEYWPTIDPTAVQGNRETMLESYRQVRDGLMQAIMKRFEVAPPAAL